MISGTGGMVGTAADYARFCNMLLAGGVCTSSSGVTTRILGVKTIEFATSNHLPDGKGLLDMIIDPKVQYSETAANGGAALSYLPTYLSITYQSIACLPACLPAFLPLCIIFS